MIEEEIVKETAARLKGEMYIPPFEMPQWHGIYLVRQEKWIYVSALTISLVNEVNPFQPIHRISFRADRRMMTEIEQQTYPNQTYGNIFQFYFHLDGKRYRAEGWLDKRPKFPPVIQAIGRNEDLNIYPVIVGQEIEYEIRCSILQEG